MSILSTFGLLLILTGIVDQLIQMIVIVPFVAKHRGLKFLDFIPGTHQYKRLLDYKKIREELGLGIFWYKVKLVMAGILMTIAVIGFFTLVYFVYYGE